MGQPCEVQVRAPRNVIWAQESFYRTSGPAAQTTSPLQERRCYLQERRVFIGLFYDSIYLYRVHNSEYLWGPKNSARGGRHREEGSTTDPGVVVDVGHGLLRRRRALERAAADLGCGRIAAPEIEALRINLVEWMRGGAKRQCGRAL